MASLNTPMKTHTEHRVMPSQPICPDKEGHMADIIQSHQYHQLLMKIRGDTDSSKKLTSPREPSPSEPEPESPKIWNLERFQPESPENWNLEEIREDPNPWSPPPKSPNWSPNCYADTPKKWEDCDFKMKNTP